MACLWLGGSVCFMAVLFSVSVLVKDWVGLDVAYLRWLDL